MSQRFLFLDWLSLRDPALAIDDTYCLTARFSSETDIYGKLGEFAAKFEGIGPQERSTWAEADAAPDAFVDDQRRLLSADPSGPIVESFLKESYQSGRVGNSVGVALSTSGFIAVAIESENTDEELRRAVRDRAECVAALVVRLVGIATSGRAPDRGFEVTTLGDTPTFLISPLTIMPVSVELFEPEADGEIDELANAALAKSQLRGLRIDKASPAGRGLLQSGNALHAVARRYTVAAEQTIRQIESVILLPDAGSATARLARDKTTDGYEVLKQMTTVLWRSNSILCCAFLAIIFLPSIAFIRHYLPFGKPNDEAVPLLFTLFFVFALIIYYAVMGLERLFDHRPQDEPIGLWNVFGSGSCARVLFHDWWILPALVAIFIGIAFGVFWTTYSLPLTSLNFFTSKGAATFISVLEKLTWGFPALAIGLLKFSHDKLAGVVIGTQEDSRYQVFLEKFDPILAAGENYARQLANVMGPEAAEKLPDFRIVHDRIASMRSRLTKMIEQAKTRFNRSAAATVAIVGAIAAIPGLTRLEPDHREDEFAQVFEAGFSAGKEGQAASIQCHVGEIGNGCSKKEEIAWQFARSVGSQSRAFESLGKDVHSVADHLDKIEQDAAKALVDEKFLVKFISITVNEALKVEGEPGSVNARQEKLVALTSALKEAVKSGSKEAIKEVLTDKESLSTITAAMEKQGESTQDKFKEAIRDAVVAALKSSNEEAASGTARDDELLVNAIVVGVSKALDSKYPGSTQGWNVNDKELAGNIAREILAQFRDSSFPVLPGLPMACRGNSHLIASVYFERSKSSWKRATCVKMADGSAYRTKAVSGKVGENDEVPECSGKASVEVATPEESGLSSKIVGSLKPPYNVDQILVVGYADSTGPVNSNIRISSDRATAVAEYLRRELERQRLEIPVSAIGRSEVSLAGEFRAGEFYESAISRRVEIRWCDKEAPEPGSTSASTNTAKQTANP